MRRTNSLLIAASAAALTLVGSQVKADWFTASYEGDALPDDPSTNPPWVNVLDSSDVGVATASVSNGILTVHTGAVTDYIDYRLDGGPGTAWDPTGAGTTLEVRVKTDFNAPGADWAGSFALGTGSRGWVIGIGAHFISEFVAGGGDFRFDTNDGFHILRFTVQDEVNGPLALYVDNATLPSKTWPGGPSGAERLDLGDITASVEGGQVEWDYLRWTNAGALVPIPPEPTWSVDASDTWNKALNWGGQIPNGVGSVAVFGGIISSPRTVFTDSPVTVGTLRFNNANRYNLTGNGSLTLEVGSGSATVDVQAGSHKINLPLFFASDTNVTVAGGAELLISNPATIMANKTVTKSGAVTIEAPLTLEAGATLVTASGPTSVFGAPSLGAGAKIDLKNTALTVDYRGQASPATTIKGQIAAAGIMSSSATATTGLGWKDDAASQSVLVKYTYLGDTNLDGQVDVIDLGNLATAWQTSGVWVNGDSNYDDFVDVIDLGLLATNWQAGVGSPLGPGSLDQALAAYGLPSVSVPEPAMLGMILLTGVAGVARRRR